MCKDSKTQRLSAESSTSKTWKIWTKHTSQSHATRWTLQIDNTQRASTQRAHAPTYSPPSSNFRELCIRICRENDKNDKNASCKSHATRWRFHTYCLRSVYDPHRAQTRTVTKSKTGRWKKTIEESKKKERKPIQCHRQRSCEEEEEEAKPSRLNTTQQWKTEFTRTVEIPKDDHIHTQAQSCLMKSRRRTSLFLTH